MQNVILGVNRVINNIKNSSQLYIKKMTIINKYSVPIAGCVYLASQFINSVDHQITIDKQNEHQKQMFDKHNEQQQIMIDKQNEHQKQMFDKQMADKILEREHLERLARINKRWW